MTKRLTLFGSVALAALLAACGGGGGGGGTSAGGSGFVPTSPTATPAQTFTNASGNVVDDGTNQPKSGVRVVLRPWTACSTPTPTSRVCPTPLPSPQATTDANGNFSLGEIPNGHYFLVIGDDTPGSHVTTVHDNVTFTGGTVALIAPTMPPIPGYTPLPAEVGGSYRIRALDQTYNEVACFDEYNHDRNLNGLPEMVVDEWLLENVIGWDANRATVPSSPPWPNNTNGILADTVDIGNGCVGNGSLPDGAFAPPAQPSAIDPREQWYAYHGTNLYGSEQHLADPATTPSTKGVVWP